MCSTWRPREISRRPNAAELERCKVSVVVPRLVYLLNHSILATTLQHKPSSKPHFDVKIYLKISHIIELQKLFRFV